MFGAPLLPALILRLLPSPHRTQFCPLRLCHQHQHNNRQPARLASPRSKRPCHTRPCLPMSATPESMQRVQQAASHLPPVVCYHHPCTDGIFAALAAHVHFKQRDIAARFWPLQVFRDPVVGDMGLTGHEVVYLLDYSGPKGFARQLTSHCARVVVLDHHKTAMDQLGVQPAPAEQERDNTQQHQQQEQQQQEQQQQSDRQHQPGEQQQQQEQESDQQHQQSVQQHQPGQQQRCSAEAVADRSGSSLPDTLHILLDMNRSGAMLALDYFGARGLPEDMLRAFRFVQDADLWTWRLQGSREFHAGLSSLGLEFDAISNPSIFDQLLEVDVDDVIRKGTAVLEEQQRQISAAVDRALTLQLGGSTGAGLGWGRALGCRVSGDLVGWRSALGNALAKRSLEMGLEPVGVVAYVEAGMEPGKLKVSLRSINDWDTTRVTEALGGGGHRAASACVVDSDAFEAWRL